MKTLTITCHRAYNYGAVLQAYALQKYLTNNGHNAQILDYKPAYLEKTGSKIKDMAKCVLRFPERKKCNKTFGRFLKDYLELTSQSFSSFEELVQYKEAFDLYITGSDQVWNMNMKNGNDDSYFLKFAPEGAKKISYAASIAMDALSDEQEKRFKQMLYDFSAVSVRESSGVELLQKAGIECCEVCDPVFLLKAQQWEQIASQNEYDEEYILVYAFYNQTEIYELARKLAEEKKCKVYAVGTGFKEKFSKVDKYFWAVSPNEFISLIKNAKTVLTNSFHGSAFSIIFNKPLYVFKTKTRGNARIIDVLKKIDKFENDESFLVSHIEDYTQVNKKIQEFRESSEEFLRSWGV